MTTYPSVRNRLQVYRMTFFFVMAAFPLAVVCAEEATDLPIRRVVMFSSGVSFFEHQGQVEGNAKIDLKFNVDDVNDLLKSMVIEDLGGGRVSTVSYGSKDPITRTLKTFSIDLTSNPSMAELLAQIRGEKIEIDAPTKVTGTIIGVEKRRQKVDDEILESTFLNLLTDEGLRSIALDKVGRIKLTNPKLDAELRQALLVLATSNSTDKKTVSLNFIGQGKRPVRVGYIQESPIWKTSYRLVLNDDEKPFLQGWAIVENTTETDWENVSLTLISGWPISFIMDLYQPLYVNRPIVQQELYASLAPRTYDQDMDGIALDFKASGKSERSWGSLAKKRAAGTELLLTDVRGLAAADKYAYALGGKSRDLANRKMNLGKIVQSVAQAGDVGELFRYTIATPVSLQRSRSAMLPIVNGSIEGEKVSIYNEATHAKHPLNGLKMKNTTGLHLMQGPITVFDDGVYAGDAQIKDLQPGTERLISYALDLDTEVASSIKTRPQQMVSCRLIKGVLYTSKKLGRTRSFTVKNSGKREKKVLIEHPYSSQWKLISPKEPAEKTRDLYRFVVMAQPGKAAKLVVEEEQTISESISVSNLTDGTIRIYLNTKVVSEDIKKALKEIVRRKNELAAVARSRQELDRQIKVIEQEQTRIRNNMRELPKDSDLYRRYLTKFTNQEDTIDELRIQVTASIAREEEMRKSLDTYLMDLNLS